MTQEIPIQSKEGYGFGPTYSERYGTDTEMPQENLETGELFDYWLEIQEELNEQDRIK